MSHRVSLNVTINVEFVALVLLSSHLKKSETESSDGEDGQTGV